MVCDVIVLGIDIGVTGAIAAVDARGTCSVADLPTLEIQGKRMVRRRIDARGLMELVRQFVPPGEVALALIEDVHTMPGRANSPQSQGSLMHSRGVVETVLELARLDVRAVQPATWKRWYGLIGSEKADGIEKARALYPLAAHLKRKKDHNRADALLLAHFGQRTMT